MEEKIEEKNATSPTVPSDQTRTDWLYEFCTVIRCLVSSTCDITRSVSPKGSLETLANTFLANNLLLFSSIINTNTIMMFRSLVWVTRPNCGKTAPGWCLLDLFRWDGLHFFNRICLSQSRFWFFLTDKNRPTREQKQWEVDDKVSLGNISFWIVTLRHELWPFLNWFQLLKVTNCRHLNMYYLLEIFSFEA